MTTAEQAETYSTSEIAKQLKITKSQVLKLAQQAGRIDPAEKGVRWSQEQFRRIENLHRLSSFGGGVHPAANLFPLMSADKLKELEQDIEQHGLQTTLKFYDNQLLDGRNRLLACLNLGIDPADYREDIDTSADFDPYAYVFSANLHRRNLTKSQIALAVAKSICTGRDAGNTQTRAARIRNSKAGGKTVPVKVPASERGDTRDLVGKAAGISGKMVDYGTKVFKRASDDLKKVVADGEMSVSKAAKLSDCSPQEQDAAAAEAAAAAAAARNGKPKPNKPAPPSPKSRPKPKPTAALDEASTASIPYDELWRHVTELPLDRLRSLHGSIGNLIKKKVAEAASPGHKGKRDDSL